MPLKYEKHTKTKTEITYTFTGFEFERACEEAGVTASRLSKITRRHIYPARFKRWCAKEDERIEIDEFTMAMLLEVLGGFACRRKPEKSS